MLRSLLRVAAAAAFAVVLAPGSPAAAPGPGIAYDEIVRIVTAGSPPPPGNFAADVAALAATPAPATPAPRRGIGLGSLAGGLGSVLSGGNIGNVAGSVAQQAAANVVADAVERSLAGTFSGLAAQVQGFLQPHLLRYAFWNGWERIDDVTGQTATIRKCDMGQVMTLDLARKTYTVYDPSAEPTPAPAAPQPARRGAPANTAPGTPAPPGTVVLDLSVTTTALGPKTIENQSTNGFSATTTVSMTQATGSCRNGSTSMTLVDYVSSLPQPTVASCPIARRPPLPETPQDAVAPPPSGGCRPTLTTHAGGAGATLPSGRLSLYTLLTMNGSAGAGPAPAPSAGGVGFLTERGNIRPLGESDAALFNVPRGFTQTQR